MSLSIEVIPLSCEVFPVIVSAISVSFRTRTNCHKIVTPGYQVNLHQFLKNLQVTEKRFEYADVIVQHD